MDPLVVDVDNGYACGVDSVWELSVPSCCCEPKIILKIVLKINKQTQKSNGVM